jgi:hypothetical protein
MATTYSVEQRESYPQWITCDQCEKEVRDSVIIDLHTDGKPAACRVLLRLPGYI